MTTRQKRIGIFAFILVLGVEGSLIAHKSPERATGERARHDHSLGSPDSAQQGAPDGKPSKAGQRPVPGISPVQRKLQSIILPVIDFEDTTVEEAVDFIRQRSAELDLMAEDRHLHRGVSFVERKPARETDTSPQGAEESPLLDTSREYASIRITLSERNISVWDALQRIASHAQLKIEIKGERIVIEPQ